MKAHKKIIIAITIALALGLGGVALATCITYLQIPDITITSHVDHDIEYAGEQAYFASDAPDTEWDKCKDECDEWVPVLEGVTVTWTAPVGSFDGHVWTAPSTAQSVTITATADDTATHADDTAKSDDVLIDVVECASVSYTTGDKCETCEWIEANEFFPYCGTPKYVKVDFDGVVRTGGAELWDYYIMKQSDVYDWHWYVSLDGQVGGYWDVNLDGTSKLEFALGGSCPVFTDPGLPPCVNDFTNDFTAGSPGPCGYGGTATVSWGPDIDEEAYCAQPGIIDGECE